MRDRWGVKYNHTVAYVCGDNTCRHSVSNPQLTVFFIEGFFVNHRSRRRIAEYKRYVLRNSPNVHWTVYTIGVALILPDAKISSIT
jgi:hypothetical protein